MRLPFRFSLTGTGRPMSNSLQTLMFALNLVPDAVAFEQAGSNEGSCKIFAFAKLNNLSDAQTLACFGHFYRHDVQGNPDGTDHANIRTFMRHGLSQVQFDGDALVPR
jgi:hypothetical protein